MSDEEGGSGGADVSPGDAASPGPAPAPDAGAPDPEDADAEEAAGAEDPGTEDPAAGAGEPEEGEWRFSLEDLPSEGEAESEGEGIAGPFGPSEEIEPGSISRESVVFVLMGVVIALLGLYLMFP